VTVEQRHEERRCEKDRRHRRSDRRHKVRDGKRLWLSPGALLWLVGLSAVVTFVVVFGVIPFYRDRAAHRVEVKAAAVQRANDLQLRVSQRRQGALLLHAFDCTYGRAVRLTLAEAARSATVSAHINLAARHAAIARGDTKAAHRSIIQYRSQKAAARRYRRVAASLQPLGTHDKQGNPFPPCKS
jgi:hypothetical protein